MHPVQIVLVALGGYALVGLIVGGWFVFGRRIGRVDAGAQAASPAARLLLWPGAAALWPLVLRMPVSGPRAADDPARRRTDGHRRRHRVVWMLLPPLAAATVMVALAGRRAAPAVPADTIPLGPPAEIAP